MTGDGNKHAGNWNSSSKVVYSGIEAGPVVIFNQLLLGQLVRKTNGDAKRIMILPWDQIWYNNNDLTLGSDVYDDDDDDDRGVYDDDDEDDDRGDMIMMMRKRSQR